MYQQPQIQVYSGEVDNNLPLLNIAFALNEDGLLPLSALNAPVQVTFAAWNDIRVGTTYQLLWNGQPTGPIKNVQPMDRPGDILTLEIPVDVLLEGKHRIAYLLTNTNNNTTNQSRPTPVEVDRTSPGNPLLAPIIFPAAALDGLTSDELQAMGNVLQGTIAGYNGMAKLDRIRTFWNGQPGPEAVVGEDDMGLRRVMVDFTRGFLESIGDIEAPVHYTVTDLAGNLSMSAAPVRVKLQLAVVAPLPVPQVREAVGDVLDPANATNGATVLVDASANLRAGDRVVVNWQGVNASDSKEKVITAAEAGLELPVLFSSAVVGANQGTTVAIAYVVHRANGVAQQSASLSLRVVGSVGLEFDTSPARLDGKVYLLPGNPEVLPTFPAGTTLHRVASGGRPPYTYRSSDERVAVVDDTGLTSVRGKGTATISVTDSQGASLSYPVTVTGVIHCVGLGGGKYTEIEAMAARQQARVPSLEEMGQIHSAYGNRWPMGHGYYWTSTVSHYALLKRMMQVKDLVTGAVPPYGIWDLSSALGVGIR
jgi:hypothetical protein